MEDGRKNNGGARPNSGRKSRKDEKELHKKLGKYSEEGIKVLIRNMKDDQPWATKMFFEYYWGKPTDQIEIKGDPIIKVEYIGK